MTENQDQTLVCADCGSNFTFSAGEQAFFREKGFSNLPKRCEDCRGQRRANQKSGQRASEPKQSRGAHDRGHRKAFPATCSRCGAQFDAPFEPKTGRPVFCRPCFQSSKRP